MSAQKGREESFHHSSPKKLPSTAHTATGINHERLTYRYAGRNFRLTDVAGVVAKDILA